MAWVAMPILSGGMTTPAYFLLRSKGPESPGQPGLLRRQTTLLKSVGWDVGILSGGIATPACFLLRVGSIKLSPPGDMGCHACVLLQVGSIGLESWVAWQPLPAFLFGSVQ